MYKAGKKRKKNAIRNWSTTLLKYVVSKCTQIQTQNSKIEFATGLFKIQNSKAIIQESSLVIPEFSNGILMIWKHFSSSMFPS